MVIAFKRAFSILFLALAIILFSCATKKIESLASEVSCFRISHYDHFDLVKTPLEQVVPVDLEYKLAISKEGETYLACYSKPIVRCLKTFKNLQFSEVQFSELKFSASPPCLRFHYDANGQLSIVDKSEVVQQLEEIINMRDLPKDSMLNEGVSNVKWLLEKKQLDAELLRDLNLIYINELSDCPLGTTRLSTGKNDDMIIARDDMEQKILDHIKKEDIRSFFIESAEAASSDKLRYRNLSAIDIFSFTDFRRPDHDSIIALFLEDKLDVLGTKGITLNTEDRTENLDGELLHLIKIRNTESGVIIKKNRTEIKRISTERGEEELSFTQLFGKNPHDENSCYRIPALLKTPNGNLLAAIDERNESCADLRSNRDINIVMRQSSDDGKTWSAVKTLVDYPDGKSASDPSMILDRETGEIFLFYNYMDLDKASGEYFFKYIKSKDDGKSWSQPIDITDQISKPEWSKDFKFITSGKGIQTKSGTLLHTLVNIEKGLHLFGSNDHGKSWFLKDTPIKPGDESKIAELSNGDWMINSRVNKQGYRHVHVSDDKGLSWTSHRDTNLIDPACNASLIRYTSSVEGHDKNRLIFSHLSSNDTRENLTLKLSYDEGKTWKYSKTIYSGTAAYSSLCILDDGDIGVFFEKDDYQENVFTKISLEWLTDGEDSLRK